MRDQPAHMRQRALGWAGLVCCGCPPSRLQRRLRVPTGIFLRRRVAARPPAVCPAETHHPRATATTTTYHSLRLPSFAQANAAPGSLPLLVSRRAGWLAEARWLDGRPFKVYRSHQSPAHAHSGAMQRSAPLCLVRRDSVCRLSPLPLADDHDDVMPRIVALLAETAPPRGPCSPPMTLRAALSSRPCFFWAKCAALDLAM